MHPRRFFVADAQIEHHRGLHRGRALGVVLHALGHAELVLLLQLGDGAASTSFEAPRVEDAAFGAPRARAVPQTGMLALTT